MGVASRDLGNVGDDPNFFAERDFANFRGARRVSCSPSLLPDPLTSWQAGARLGTGPERMISMRDGPSSASSTFRCRVGLFGISRLLRPCGIASASADSVLGFSLKKSVRERISSALRLAVGDRAACADGRGVIAGRTNLRPAEIGMLETGRSASGTSSSSSRPPGDLRIDAELEATAVRAELSC